jgi:hypothetical protein
MREKLNNDDLRIDKFRYSVCCPSSLASTFIFGVLWTNIPIYCSDTLANNISCTLDELWRSSYQIMIAKSHAIMTNITDIEVADQPKLSCVFLHQSPCSLQLCNNNSTISQ